jgi:D-alanyl-D-alanine carboxypeptidase/D-alanyl-D-alanine-endopeptidase (penicillin-binding protein 4)
LAAALAFFLAGGGLSAGDLPPRSSLVEAIEKIAGRPELKTSTLGISIAAPKSGEVLFELNADKLFAPASNTKIVSCAGALAALGKDYRFETRVVAAGPVRDGALKGDLVLVAVGDPNLSQRVGPEGKLRFENKDHSYAGFYDATLVPGDPLQVVKDLARQVAEAGLREIQGDVVVDDGFFEETYDEFVGSFSAVCVNDNLVDVLISPGAQAGEPATFEVKPRGTLVSVRSEAKTIAAGSEADLWLEPTEGIASFVLKGAIPADSKPVLRVASPRNPVLLAASYLSDELRALGVVISGKERQARLGPAAYRECPAVARHVSPPLSEALRVILKVSHNLHATMLPVLVGAVRAGHGNREAGYKVVHDLFEKEGLDMEAVVLQSGSGGGRGDFISPRWTVEFLRHLTAREDFPVFFDALPIGGADGTLASAFHSEELGHRVHAKTGTLVYRGALNDRWVYVSKSLSGYLDLGISGRPEELVPFSIIIANTLTESRRKGSEDLFRAQEDILRAVLKN